MLGINRNGQSNAPLFLAGSLTGIADLSCPVICVAGEDSAGLDDAPADRMIVWDREFHSNG